MDKLTTVAVVVTRPETVLADYARLLALAGVVEAAGDAGARRWNLVPAPPLGGPGPAAACPPWQLEGVVRALLAAGHAPDDITLTAAADLRRDREPLLGWRRVLRGLDLDDTPVAPGAQPPGASRLLLANLRTQARLGLLGAVAAYAASVRADQDPAELLALPEALETAWRRDADSLAGAVIDATVAGDGAHGSALVPVAAHVLLGGRDPVAVDAVACRLAGLAPHQVPLLGQAVRLGLGCAELDAIDLVGDTAAMPTSLDLVTASRFRAGGHAAGPRWWRRWRAAVGERWPRPLARRRARRRYESQPWGRLHAEYDRRGIIGGGDG